MRTAVRETEQLPISHYWGLVKSLDRRQQLELATMIMEHLRDEEDEANELAADDLGDEERAYWTQSIERDLADIASGKPRKYVSGDEFWSTFEEAVEKRYEEVQA